jgi:hypothetical protein
MRPIEKKNLSQMSTIMDVLTGFFPGYGIALMVFKLPSPEPSSRSERIHYVCNAERNTLLAALKEFIARHENLR